MNLERTNYNIPVPDRLLTVLRYVQSFDIFAVGKSLDWFKVMMTCNLHPLTAPRDSADRFVGPIVNAHTKITEINSKYGRHLLQ